MITTEQIKSSGQGGYPEKVPGYRYQKGPKWTGSSPVLEPGFWDDPKEAEKFLKELAAVKFWVSGYDKVASETADLDVLYDFAKESASGECRGTVHSRGRGA